MFSPMIQNLISSSGQQAAMARAVQLNSYINAPTHVPHVGDTTKTEGKSFSEVLKNSSAQQTSKISFGGVLNNTSTSNVQGEILTDKSKVGKFGALTGLGDISKLTATNPINDISNISNNIEISNVASNAPKSQIIAMIDKVAKKHGVDEKLVRAVVRQESGFNPNATSHCGAMGLMQLMPATAKGLGVTDPYNPVQNVEGGVKYLKNLLNKYNGNVILALAAYNAGSGAVAKYNGVPPYKETQNYVKSIMANYL